MRVSRWLGIPESDDDTPQQRWHNQKQSLRSAQCSNYVIGGGGTGGAGGGGAGFQAVARDSQ